MILKMSQDSTVNIVNDWYLILAKSVNIFIIFIVVSTPTANPLKLSTKREVRSLSLRIKLP